MFANRLEEIPCGSASRTVDFHSLQALALHAGEARTAEEVLQRVVRGLSAQQNVALARVWLVLPGDICGSCRMRHECTDRSRCLHIVASAGQPVASAEDWSRLDGDFRRMPLNARKVGQIGGSGKPILISKGLDESPWVARPDWARRESVAAFAGHPLVFRGEILGVLAVFCRAEITESESDWIRIFADHAAIAIANARAFEELARLRRQLEAERDYLREEVKEALAFGDIVGESVALRGVLEQVERVAPTDATVLILGESGTGKELIASAIHERSPRREHPLVRVNCGSIPSELFESEFFGHAKGSFTGAVRDRVGRFQHAHGGTLFLDEVGEIPLAHQAKLLRVLQEGKFERVGDDATREVNTRIVAATNRNLKREVSEGHFRQDLYYRLSVFPIELPPLRHRKGDIPALAKHFISLSSCRLKRAEVRFTKQDAESLMQYDWPGNIRELQNVIERAVILARGPQLPLAEVLPKGASLDFDAASALHLKTDSVIASKIMTSDELTRVERQNIMAALEHARWKISGVGGAAELLGMNPGTLASRMRTLGIKRSRTE